LPLAALIFAPLTDADMPAATSVSIAGQNILDYQVREVRRAGVQHILVFADRMTSGVIAASDRLARDGIKIEIVRSAIEAGDHLHPDELAIIIAANVVAEQALYAKLASASEMRVLGLRDSEGLETLERIDGFTRWSGLALLSGALIRQTAQTIGEWDFSATLLRTALQSGVVLDIDDQRHEGAPLIKIVYDQASAADLSRRLAKREPVVTNGLIDHYIWSPLASLIMPRLLQAELDPNVWVAAVGLLTLLTLASVWIAPMIVPPIFFLAAGLAASIAHRLVKIGLRDSDRLNPILAARVVVGGITLVVMVRHLVDYGIGWGYYILALWLLVEMARAAFADPWFRGMDGLPNWRMSPDAAAIAILLGHITNFDVLALEISVAYAIASNAALMFSRRFLTIINQIWFMEAV
jgi:hypothetical protein